MAIGLLNHDNIKVKTKSCVFYGFRMNLKG